ncbi:MAG: glycosyltransferase [Candidatus Brocadiia bacterium]
MNDLVILACCREKGAAEMLRCNLLDEQGLVVIIEPDERFRPPLWRILVAPPDVQQATQYLRHWDTGAWDIMFVADGTEPAAQESLLTKKARSMQKHPEARLHSGASEEELLGDETMERIKEVVGDLQTEKLQKTISMARTTEAAPPEVSIIILMHNKWQFTKRCLYGLLATRDVRFELLLVDNGSTEYELKEGMTVFLSECQLRNINVTMIIFPENVGAVRGRNEALPYCRGDYIVFMDNDVVVRNLGWLYRLKEFLRSEPSYGAVGPKLVYPNHPHLIQCAGCDVAPTGRVDFRGRGEPRETPGFTEPRDVQALISACIVFPRQVVEMVGTLNMEYHPVQFEDIDYCYRIKEKGFKLAYRPDVEMYHFENVTTGRTRALNYKYLTVKNGQVFKNLWSHVFSRENGPLEEAMIWKEIPSVAIDDIGELEVFE